MTKIETDAETIAVMQKKHNKIAGDFLKLILDQTDKSEVHQSGDVPMICNIFLKMCSHLVDECTDIPPDSIKSTLQEIMRCCRTSFSSGTYDLSSMEEELHRILVRMFVSSGE